MGNVIGNVHAATAPNPQFLAPEPPPPPPGYNDKKPEVPQEAPPTTDGSKHPGVMEDLHKRTKDVFPTNFEGIKFMVNKGLSSHFQVSHSLTLSAVTPSSYRFGATYVGTNQTGPNEAFPILLGDIDPSGNMNANIIHQLGSRLRLKFAGQITKNQLSASQYQADYKGDQYSASVTVANPDIANDAGLFVGQYLQSITSQISLGAEFVCQFSPQIPGKQLSFLSLAGRYNADDNAFSATLGSHAVHLCYYQKASEQLQLGCELDTNFRNGESVASIGYQIDLPKIDLVFRGMVDSNWSVGAVLEKKMPPLPFTLSLSGILSHSTQNFRLGFGFVIG